ncbi:hypothetical protein ABPG75_005825 [Micractinium tetrahymenae]
MKRAPPPPAPPNGQAARNIPFSTHTRGVPLFDRSRFFDLPRHAALALLDLRDISSALFWFLSCQTWLTLWSTLITLISVVFFTYYTDGNGQSLAADMDWVLLCSVAVLPAVGFLLVAYLRRERCLGELAKAKVLMMSLFTSHRDWVPDAQRPEGHMEAVQEALATTTDAMRAYFSPMRFYSRYYPYMGSKAAMVHIALERTRQMRRIHEGMETLQAAATALHSIPLSPALVAQLHERTLQLQLSIELMANVKEFRTPQGVRSLSRFYLILFLPIFFGPYWAWISQQTNFGFSFFFCILLQWAVVGLVNVTIALEDPFDNNGMDGIFLDEALYEVDQLVGAPPGWSDEAEQALHVQQQQLVVAGQPAGPPAGQPQSPTAVAAVGLGRAATASLAKLPAAPAPVTDTV